MKRNTDYVRELIKLSDWHIGKVCSYKYHFEVFMGTNNGKMVCYINSPVRSYPFWNLHIADSDTFDGNWKYAPFIVRFDKFYKLKEYLKRIDTNQKIDGCKGLIFFKNGNN